MCIRDRPCTRPHSSWSAGAGLHFVTYFGACGSRTTKRRLTSNLARSPSQKVTDTDRQTGKHKKIDTDTTTDTQMDTDTVTVTHTAQ
eukprot:2528369-Rhodomonas_salina.1